MITEFMRDQAFAISLFGLMVAVWFGMAQEDPGPKSRLRLWVGSAIGLIIAAAFGVIVGRNWNTPSALDNGVWWVFGATFIVMSLFIGGGAIFLKIRKRYRWFGWWIALCVAVHFAPLVWVFEDWTYLVLSVVQVAGLVLMFPRLKRAEYETSRLACSWLGVTFLACSAVSAIVFLIRYGYPY
ncbi:hypothetical protein [Gulosibacter sp. 10]|uniref:hypothetical protein n=1 Tax=Gulosibacter sp. 10 TaxID=1255570 RepID=UPI000B34CBAC|nr:hypothetical protein [Gulosibacter sp. 10]